MHPRLHEILNMVLQNNDRKWALLQLKLLS